MSIEGSFILVKVQESSDVSYIECESDGDNLCKIVLVIEYLDKIRQNFKNIVKKLKSTGSLWKKIIM